MLQIRNRTLNNDPWRLELAPPEQCPSADIAPGDVVVCLSRWVQDQDTLVARGTRIGVRVAPDEDVMTLVGEHFHEIWLVDLEFTGFAEGRGYSQARQLRTGLGYLADIRAVGDVSRDRVAFMERCGINVFQFTDESRASDALEAFEEIGPAYQDAADGARIVPRLRGFRRAASAA